MIGEEIIDVKKDVPMISVIMPVYNTKQYVQQAVDSVLNQTFKDLQLILIDDCSTDGSYELLQELYGKNERVKLLRNARNLGVWRTENRGIRNAVGKYIAFLDNDDVHLPNALERLYNVAESQQADVVSSFCWLQSESEDIPKNFAGKFNMISEGTPVQQVTVISPPSDDFQIMLNLYLRGEFGFACSWNKLYSRQFIFDNGIHFPINAGDRGFTFQCVLHAKKYVKVPFPTTIYRNRIVSTSRHPPSPDALAKTPGSMSKFAADFENIMNEFKFFRENPIYKYRVIERQLLAWNLHSTTRYYRNSQSIDPELIKRVYEKTSEDFGEHAPFINWIFHRAHIFYQMSVELSARVQQLEAQIKQSTT